MRRFIVAALVFVLAVPALAEDIELVTGEVLRGRVVERSAAGVSLEHPILGKLWISATNVAKVDGEPIVSAIDHAVADFTTETATDPEAAPADEVPEAERWKFKIEVGANGKEGNGDTSDLRAAIEAKQEDEHKRWKFRAIWNYSEADGEDTKDNVDLSGVRDFLIPGSKWFFYAAGRHEWDSFQDWSRRLTLSVGVGRELIDNDTFKLRGRAGYSTVNETGTDAESWRPEGVIGGEAEWTITENQFIEANTFYFPDFDSRGQYRLTSRVQYKIKLTDFDNIAIAAGFDNEYDTHRKDEFDRNEINYYVALLYEF